MSSILPQELINHLIRIGESESFDECEQLPNLYPQVSFGVLWCSAKNNWYELANTLSDHELVALIKTFTEMELRLSLSGGSVAPVIWLYKSLSGRSSDNPTPLADWVLERTENMYLPFGTNNRGAKSCTELEEIVKREQKEKRLTAEYERTRELEAKSLRAADATRKLFGAIHRNDQKAITSLLAKGADIHAANEQGQTACEIAKSAGLLHLLIPHNAGPTNFG